MGDRDSSTTAAVDWRRLAGLAPRAVLIGLLAGWAIALAAGPVGSSSAFGGDYPAFHSAGRMALDGRLDQLYDFKLQGQYQEGMPAEGLLPFLYPPFVATVYAPLAMLPYRAAYALYTLLALAALAASVRVLRTLSPTAAVDPWLLMAAALLFYPMLRATMGGQNTAISLLILCTSWRLFHDQRDLAAGLVLGLLCYKPQFLVPIAGLVLLSGRFRACGGVLLTVTALLAWSTAVAGLNWPIQWAESLSSYAPADRQINAYSSISLGQITDLLGWHSGWILLSGALSAWAAWLAWTKGRSDFFAVFAIGIVASLLIPPHAMYYDFGIALPAILLLADRGYPRAAAAIWIGGASQLLAPPLPLSPILALPLVLLVLLRRSMECGAARAPDSAVLTRQSEQ